MCGIVGYVGHRPVSDVLLEGLRLLEYRGYDSAGVAIVTPNGTTFHERAVRGKDTSGIDVVASMLAACGPRARKATAGIGHTRWATHGKPSVENAHPHTDCARRLFLVHNGELTNDRELREALLTRGHTLRSETDTELIAHRIEEVRRAGDGDLEDAVRTALEEVDGALAIAVVAASAADRIICARRGGTLLVGIGDGETVIASDEAAIVAISRRIVELKDGDVVTVTADGIAGRQRVLRIATWDPEQAQRGGYATFTRKEISEQPDTIRRCLNHGGRLQIDDGTAKLGGLEPLAADLRHIDHVRLVGAGTAYHAALVGRQMLLEVAGIPHVEAECASEVHAASFHVGPTTAVVAISQSGETVDTLAAVQEAKQKGARTIGVVNKVATAIAREVDCGVYCNAGPEIGVASTKAYVAQLTVLALLTLFFGRQRRLNDDEGRRIAEHLLELPGLVDRAIAAGEALAARVGHHADAQAFFMIGRKWHHPIALEGALKAKELAYVHAEGYAAGELKHGPLAVLNERTVVLALAPRDETFHDVLLAVHQARRTGSTVIGITTPDAVEEVAGASGTAPVVVPATLPMLQPIVSVIPLQLFAHALAVELGRDVDKPRNLAKSVTVK